MFATIKKLLEATQLQEILAQLSATEFEDGAATAGESARSVKKNLQAAPNHPKVLAAGKLVVETLQRNEPFLLATRPKSIVAPLFSRYEPGMEYGSHLDNPVMGGSTPVRTDISVTILLNHASEYDGGELVIEADQGPFTFKGEAGSAIVYPSTMPHHVNQVTRGQRLAAVTWVQSMVRSPERRRILFDLALLANRLKQSGAPQRELAEKCHANLFRMWAEL